MDDSADDPGRPQLETALADARSACAAIAESLERGAPAPADAVSRVKHFGVVFAEYGQRLGIGTDARTLDELYAQFETQRRDAERLAQLAALAQVDSEATWMQTLDPLRSACST